MKIELAPMAVTASPLSRLHEANPLRAGKAGKAALEFESVLLGSLLESMEQSVSSLGAEESESGSENLKGFSVQALGSALAKTGGIGIARMLLPYLQRQEQLSGVQAKVRE
jgi:Rod binding domain-containing protein